MPRARVDALRVDDCRLAVLSSQVRRVGLELLDDRHGTRATTLTSQLPAAPSHAVVGDPTLADSIRNRLFHNARRIEPSGRSRGKEGTLEG